MATSLALHNTTRNQPVCGTVTAAISYWSRLRGLLFRPEPQPGTGLLLLPSRGIHTFFMGYAIDVVFLDRELRVQRLCEAVAPWRVRLPSKDTHCVLELHKYEAGHSGLAVGDQLQLQRYGQAITLPHLQSTTQHPERTAGTRALWFVLAFLLLVQAALCWSARKPALAGRVDLRAYYAAGTAARLQGLDGLYSDAVEHDTQQKLFHDGWRTLHFLYPPFAVLPYRALAAVPYPLAFVLMSLVSVASLVCAAVLLARTRPAATVSPVVLSACALCMFPSVMALTQGQLSFVLLLLLTAFYCLQRRGLHVLAGVCLALGMIKVQVVLPIAVLYLLWRRYRVFAGFALGTAVLAGVSAAMVGMGGLQEYAARLHGMAAVTLRDGAAAFNQFGVHTSAEPNLHGVAVALLGDGARSALLTLLLSLAVLVWSTRQRASAGTAVCAALLLSYHLLPYDLVLLLLPMALQVMELLPVRSVQQLMTQRSLKPWLLAGSVLLLSAPVASWLMMHNAMTWYVLACVALLFASSSRRTHSSTAPGPRAAALTLRAMYLAS